MSQSSERVWICAGWRLPLERPLIMGIVNVTPDSFSDGGLFVDPEAALARGQELVEAGADLLDVGGESTRPGAEPVSADEECRRVIPVIAGLSRRISVPISVDTTKSEVAAQALEAGACIVNDVSAACFDARMLPLMARTGAGLILMHRQGTPPTMQENPHYDDVVREVRDKLAGDIRRAERAGVLREALVVDPGIGFGKTTAHNLDLLANLDAFAELGRPLLVGLSRKRFLGELTGRPVMERLAGGVAALTWCALRGAAVLRVHDVAATRDAMTVLSALAERRGCRESEDLKR